MRQRIVRESVHALRTVGLHRIFMDTPRGFLPVKEWIDAHREDAGVNFIPLYPAVPVTENPPIVIDRPVSGRFTRHYQRTANPAFVAVIPKGRGVREFSNLVITDDGYLLSDVSREFGAEGGRKPRDFSLFHDRFKMPAIKKIAGRTAVISTCGANNYHHWIFDILPRLHLLRKAGLLDEMDHYILHHRGLPFQVNGLQRMGIDTRKIINPADEPAFFVECEELTIPALPEDLGTITPWVVDFLRATFLPAQPFRGEGYQKLFISRKKAPSRRIINEKEVTAELFRRGYTEFFPEDHPMEETAAIFAQARSMVAVHGSGYSNLPFAGENARVLDIMAPFHQDPYYWMLCNQRKAVYVALFSEGAHPPDDADLVKRKVDEDLLIDMNKLNKALDLLV